ncbi:MAG: ABC transporter ATP-binding protein [Lachnospiraceae bacterium]
MRKESITRQALRRYSAYNPKYFPLKLLQLLFDNASPYFNLWMSSEIVTALYEGRGRKELYLLVGIALLGNLFIRICSAFLGRMVNLQAEILDYREAEALNRKTLSLDYDKLENPEIRQLRRKITENSYVNGYGVYYMKLCVETWMAGAVNILFSGILFAEMLSFLGRTAFSIQGLLFLLAMVVCIMLRILFSFWSRKESAKCNKEIGDMMLEENRLGRGYTMQGMDNRIYRQQKLVTELHRKCADKHLKLFSKVSRRLFVRGIPGELCVKLSELFSYLIVCLYCIQGVFPVGSVIKYVGYLSRMIDSITTLFGVSGWMKTNESYLKDYLDYFEIQNDMYQGSLAVEKRSDKRFEIEFKDVSFRYAGAKKDALRNINLKLKVGERLAVVGRNGSGKTTFIKLLCRLYDPTEGEIYMNDFNIRKYDYRQYLDIFSVVFQDYHLLSLPLGNNVASAESWDTEKAERLLHKVGFGERYAELPKGLETPLYKDFDEDGVNVSGGEAQKIAMARALYRDAPFIILDEPTAALDPIAEAEIYARFDEIVGDKTAIYISHRLSSCRFCDKIAVFDEGEIVQVGTHEELLADENGKYYELWNAQAQYYQEKGA